MSIKANLSIGITTLFVWSFDALAQIPVRPALTAARVEIVCDQYRPYVRFELPLLRADIGRPGILYIGMHDSGGTQAAFLSESKWINYQGGLFPTFEVNRIGLLTRTFVIPLNPNLAGGGWKLYVGYGALTLQAEQQVQASISIIAEAKAINGGKTIAAVDPDHYRRSLVQGDLMRYGKYAYIETGVEWTANLCQPEGS